MSRAVLPLRDTQKRDTRSGVKSQIDTSSRSKTGAGVLDGATPDLSRSRLSQAFKQAVSLIDAFVTGYDRITISVDNPEPVLPLQDIGRYCNKVTLLANRAEKFHPIWQSRLEILQPSMRALNLLMEAMQGRYRARLDYAEIAIDWIVDSPSSAEKLRNALLARMTVPYGREPVVCVEGNTFYYSRRASGADRQKAPHNVVLYADRTSKLWGKYAGKHCCHLEHRFSGSESLAKIGIFSVADLCMFSHRDFWRDNMRLFSLPSKASIGRFLSPANDSCSGTALRDRAEKLCAPYRLDGVLVLQNLRLAHPEIDALLAPIDNRVLLG